MNVFEKLQLARVRLQSSKLEKSGRNDFAGYDYFELGDFLPQTQAIFGEIGLCGIVNYSLEGCSLAIYNTEDPNEKLVFMSPWAEAQLKGCHPIQNLGAAETYQRRYLWVTAMEIVEHDALDATTGSEEGKQEMVMTNRLVPKHYWEATDQIAKDKIIGSGNSIRKNDADKKWYIVEPKSQVPSPLGRLSDDAKIAGMIPTKETELPATPAAVEGEIHWNGRVEKVTEKSTANGANYWQIETDVGECFCKNKQLVEELKIMGSEAMRFHVQESTRRRGAYELVDFEGGLA